MKILDLVKKVFETSKESILIVERFHVFKVSYEIDNFDTFIIEDVLTIISTIEKNDSYRLSIKIGNNDAIVLTSNNLIVFSKEIQKERAFIDDETVTFSLEIQKNTNDFIRIYDYASFVTFWKDSSLIEILDFLIRYSNESNIIYFVSSEVLEDYFSGGFFMSSTYSVTQENKIRGISENCHFGNIENYQVSADSFFLQKRPSEDNAITKKLDNLTLLFSIIGIFDFTSFRDSSFNYKLNGYKSFQGELDVNSLDNDLVDIYYKIYDWVYSQDGNLVDKLGICRNIISLSLSENSLSISESTYLSILSGYKTYLQENISKYIEVRNKIFDELNWISQKSSEIISSYLNNYQKSIFTFLSFFISVFILRFLKGGTTVGTFSKEVTFFCLAFLGLSGIFLLYSNWNLQLEKKRLKRKYRNLKNRFVDLLDIHDIERILSNDDEFNYEISYIAARQSLYTKLWLFTIILLFSVILTVSDYLNWSVLIDELLDLFQSATYYIKQIKWYVANRGS